eukprot:40532-Pelagomonas_calceolata.AAC.5
MMMSVGLGPCVVQRWKLSEEEQECLAYFNGNGGDQEMKGSSLLWPVVCPRLHTTRPRFIHPLLAECRLQRFCLSEHCAGGPIIEWGRLLRMRWIFVCVNKCTRLEQATKPIAGVQLKEEENGTRRKVGKGFIAVPAYVCSLAEAKTVPPTKPVRAGVQGKERERKGLHSRTCLRGQFS